MGRASCWGVGDLLSVWSVSWLLGCKARRSEGAPHNAGCRQGQPGPCRHHYLPASPLPGRSTGCPGAARGEGGLPQARLSQLRSPILPGERARVSMATQVGGEKAAPVTKKENKIAPNFPSSGQSSKPAACPAEAPRAPALHPPLPAGDPPGAPGTPPAPSKPPTVPRGAEMSAPRFPVQHQGQSTAPLPPRGPQPQPRGQG